MGRLLIAGVLVATAFGVASAGPTRKVRIETTPAGATVYLDSVENGAVCEATPCTINAPLGEVTIIVQLDKHQPEFEMIEVKRGKSPLPVSINLKAALGMLVVDSPEGAKVELNDQPIGEVPLRLEVPAEPSRVVVKLGGKTLYDEFVDIEVGSDTEIKVKKAVATVRDNDVPDELDGDDDDDDGDTDGGRVRAGTRAAARSQILQAGLAFDIAFRLFEYSNGELPFRDIGEVVLGPAVEFWPGRLVGVSALRGMSVFGRIQFAPTHRPVTTMENGAPVGAETFWGAAELSLRNQWVFGERIGIEASGGYVRDQAEFNTTTSVLMQVPSADYHSIRLGVRASIVGKVEPFISAENRFVLSAGNLAMRGASSKVSGFRFSAGAATKLGPLGARVEGSYTQYTWSFEDDGVTTPPGPGASDKIFWISFVLGYQY